MTWWYVTSLENLHNCNTATEGEREREVTEIGVYAYLLAFTAGVVISLIPSVSSEVRQQLHARGEPGNEARLYSEKSCT